MAAVVWISLILIIGANAVSSSNSSSFALTNSTSDSGTTSRNVTATTPTSQSAAESQDGQVTGPAYYQTTEISSHVATRELWSGLTVTVTDPDGNLETVVGPTTFANLVFHTDHKANLVSSQSQSYHPWDPSQFGTGFFSMAHGKPTGDPSLFPAWSSYTDYGRKAECTEEYSKFVATKPVETITTLRNIGFIDVNSKFQDSQGYTRIVQTNSKVNHCCGTCEFVYLSVQLFYWPAEHPNTACLETVTTAASSATAPEQERVKQRRQDQNVTSAPRGGGVYATDGDGFV